MTTDWNPTQDDIAATRNARKAGNFKNLLRQQIADGRAKLPSAAHWPASRQRSDLYGFPCPHCGAGVDQKCHLRTRDKQLPHPHQQRVANWALTTAGCPECQVEPGTRCHTDGIPLLPGTVHARRYQEAEEVAA